MGVEDTRGMLSFSFVGGDYRGRSYNMNISLGRSLKLHKKGAIVVPINYIYL